MDILLNGVPDTWYFSGTVFTIASRRHNCRMTSGKCSPNGIPNDLLMAYCRITTPGLGPGAVSHPEEQPSPPRARFSGTVVCPHLAAAFICFRVHSVANVSFVSEVDSKACVNGSPCETAKTSYSVKRETEQARVMQSKKNSSLLVPHPRV